jgi:hypothetical protein
MQSQGEACETETALAKERQCVKQEKTLMVSNIPSEVLPVNLIPTLGHHPLPRTVRQALHPSLVGKAGVRGGYLTFTISMNPVLNLQNTVAN